MQTIAVMDMTVRSNCYESVEINEGVSKAPSDVPGDLILLGEVCPMKIPGEVPGKRLV